MFFFYLLVFLETSMFHIRVFFMYTSAYSQHLYWFQIRWNDRIQAYYRYDELIHFYYFAELTRNLFFQLQHITPTNNYADWTFFVP